ncbi:MAG: caspase family protein [Pseudomonadota bacterium]
MRRLIVLILSILVATEVAAEDDRQAFMLDLEAHVAPIQRLAVHEERGFVVTGSSDRSLRFWSLDDGEAWAVRHPPHGPDRAGQITSVAALPSGLAVFAARSPDDPPNTTTLYITEPKEGRILAKRGPYPGTINTLSYLAEGRFLAAAAGSQGLVLLDRRLQEVWRINLSGGRHVWAEFGAGRRLATATDDGQVAVCEIAEDDGARTPLLAITAPDGMKPGSVAFSPDAQQIAIAYDDAALVDIYDVDRNERLRRLTASNVVGGGALNRVGWAGTAEENVLYAGGTLLIGGRNAVVAWRGGEGPGLAIPVARDSISHIVGLSNGDAVFASTFPSWGRLSAGAPAEGSVLERAAPAEVAFLRNAPKLDFRNTGLRGRFAIAPDGGSAVIVPSAYSQSGRDRPVSFDLRRLAYDGAVATPGGGLHRPAAARAGTEVTGLRTTEPRIAGRPIRRDGEDRRILGVTERALSADVATDGSRALIGGDFALYLTDRSGLLTASLPLPAAAWSVALAPAADLAVAALGDGTVRWFALGGEAGVAEIASVFLHADRATWVAWRRDGRFAHSSFGGSDLGGYVVNRTRRNAEGRIIDFAGAWVSMADMYGRMYDAEAVSSLLDSPAIWDKIADGEAISTLLALAERPVFGLARICPPEDGTAESCVSISEAWPAPGALKVADWAHGAQARLLIRADEEAAKLDRIQVYRNGRFAGVHRVAELETLGEGADSHIALPLALAEGENTLALRGYDRNGVYQQRTVALLRRESLPPEPTLHILAVGVANYGNPALRLQAAAHDAQSIVAYLEEYAVDDFEEIGTVRILTDTDATRDGILGALSDIAAVADADDTVLLYFAGHGETGEHGYVFLPHEVRGLDWMYDDGLSNDRLLDAVGAIRARSMLFMVDTCYADAVDTRRLSHLAHTMQSYFLLASNNAEKAQDLARDSQNGVFAHALLAGLSGAAALSGEETVDAIALGLYVEREPRRMFPDGGGPEVIFRTGKNRLQALPLTYTREPEQ